MRGVLVAGALALIGFGAVGMGELKSESTVIEDDPNPLSATASVTDETGYHSSLDWDTIKAECPDVAGWVSVPGTDIDFPIMAPTADNPDYYLHHDCNGDESKLGEIYVDVDSQGLFNLKNTVLYGHHIAYGEPHMFRSVSYFSDKSFAEEHRQCIIETPEVAYLCDLAMVEIVEGNIGANKPGMSDADEFSEWWETRRDNACIVMTEEVPDQVVSLVTCSYHYSANERTVAYFKVAEVLNVV